MPAVIPLNRVKSRLNPSLRRTGIYVELALNPLEFAQPSNRHQTTEIMLRSTSITSGGLLAIESSFVLLVGHWMVHVMVQITPSHPSSSR